MKNKVLILAGFACLTVAYTILRCSEPACAPSSDRHTWSKWTNEWESANSCGFMKQARYCQTCGERDARTGR